MGRGPRTALQDLGTLASIPESPVAHVAIACLFVCTGTVRPAKRHGTLPRCTRRAKQLPSAAANATQRKVPARTSHGRDRLSSLDSSSPTMAAVSEALCYLTRVPPGPKPHVAPDLHAVRRVAKAFGLPDAAAVDEATTLTASDARVFARIQMCARGAPVGVLELRAGAWPELNGEAKRFKTAEGWRHLDRAIFGTRPVSSTCDPRGVLSPLLLEALARMSGRALGLDGALLGSPLRLVEGTVGCSSAAVTATIAQPCICAHVRSSGGKRSHGEALGATLTVSKRKKDGVLQLRAHCEHEGGVNDLVPGALTTAVHQSLAALYGVALERTGEGPSDELGLLRTLESSLPPPPSRSAIDRLRLGTWTAFRSDGRAGQAKGALVGRSECSPSSARWGLLEENHACLMLQVFARKERVLSMEPSPARCLPPAATLEQPESSSASSAEVDEEAEGMAESLGWESFDAEQLVSCLCEWDANEAARDAAEEALLVEEEQATDQATRMRAKALRQALSHFRVRHHYATLLGDSADGSAVLGPADADGWRWQAVRYEHGRLAGGEGRRYAKECGRALDKLRNAGVDDNGSEGKRKRRSRAAQGMPSDLRRKLMGRGWRDYDGYCSDLIIYLHLAASVGMPPDAVDRLVAYTGTEAQSFEQREAQRTAWHQRVAAHHGVDEATVKRWPNILGNDGSYKLCCEKAGLQWATVKPMREMTGLEEQLRALKAAVLASPIYHDFVARRRAELVHLSVRDANCKIFSQLVGSKEDEIMGIATAAARALEREVLGDAAYAALPRHRRDANVNAFDGRMRMDTPGLNPRRVEARMNEAIAAAGWGGYTVREKDMFGLQDQPMETWKRACEVMVEAPAAFPRVREAIEAPCREQLSEASPSTDALTHRARDSHRVAASRGERDASSSSRDGRSSRGSRSDGPVGRLAHRARWTPCGTQPAFVLLILGDQVLLPLEVRGGERRYGLLGGKGEVGETPPVTAAREAAEETGGKLSAATRVAISASTAIACCPTTRAHVFLHRLAADSPDANLHSTFDGWAANRRGSATRQEGVTWVPVAALCNIGWRRARLHEHAQFMLRSVARFLSA